MQDDFAAVSCESALQLPPPSRGFPHPRDTFMTSLKLLGRLLRDTFNNFLADRTLRMAGALAYYSVFAMAPLILIAIGVASQFFDKQASARADPRQRDPRHRRAVGEGGADEDPARRRQR